MVRSLRFLLPRGKRPRVGSLYTKRLLIARFAETTSLEHQKIAGAYHRTSCRLPFAGGYGRTRHKALIGFVYNPDALTHVGTREEADRRRRCIFCYDAPLAGGR